MMRVLGLDVGIGSCGWGVLEIETIDATTGEVVHEDRVVACGARCFDVPEEAKTKELKNKARRTFRGQRRMTRRRAQRLAAVRRVLAGHGLMAEPGALPPGTPSGIVWTLRAEGLRRRLTPDELSRVLIHIAKHRGFKSNSRRAQANAKSEDSKMLAAVTALDQKAACYRTVGEMLALDPAFALRKRNTPGDYSHTLKRERVEDEARTLLAEQRRLGNTAASEALEQAYVAAAFFQRPLQSSVSMIGKCRFEPDEIRSPRHAPSFERFRFLSRLNNLRVSEQGKAARPLGPAERSAALALFGATQKVTFKQLRKALRLGEQTRFDGLPGTKDPEAATFADATGTVTLKKALGEVR
jgi:CRISPR-associated endonuclease Csn1